MAGLKLVAGRPDRDLIGIDLAGFDRLWLLERAAETRADNTVVEQDGLAVRVHVDQLGGEVGVLGA